MPKLDHIVTSLEVSKAYRAWYLIMNHERGGRTFSDPHKFFGQDDMNLRPALGTGIPVSKLAYQKIKMLNSPYARTLLKAFKARTGYHKDIP